MLSRYSRTICRHPSTSILVVLLALAARIAAMRDQQQWMDDDDEGDQWWFEEGACVDETLYDTVFTPQEGDHFYTGQRINVSWYGDPLDNWDEGNRPFTWSAYLHSLDDMTNITIIENRTWTTPYDGNCHSIDSCGNTELFHEYVIPIDLQIVETLFEVIVVNITDPLAADTTTGGSFVIDPTDFVVQTTGTASSSNSEPTTAVVGSSTSPVNPTNPNPGTQEPTTYPDATTADESSGGLTAAQGIGIGVGLSVMFVVIAIAIFFMWRRWNARNQVTEVTDMNGRAPDTMPPVTIAELPIHHGNYAGELPGSSPSMEMDGISSAGSTGGGLVKGGASPTIRYEIMGRPAPGTAAVDDAYNPVELEGAGTGTFIGATLDPSPVSATDTRTSSEKVRMGSFLDV